VEIKLCNKCSFILGTRPNLRFVDGVCLPCINSEKKKEIDFKARQKWLNKYFEKTKSKEYDCAIAVSGGKDSWVIVKKLFENHNVKKALLINIADEFTRTKAGRHNLNNLVKKFNCDLITLRLNPDEVSLHMRRDFEETLNPLKWVEEILLIKPPEIARRFGINTIFYGENPHFEYGGSDELDIFAPNSTNTLKIIYLGAIYPYSAMHWYEEAKEMGFIDLDYFNEWQRQGQIENYSQIDSIGYIIGIWTKFVKFGFQRVSDIACRLVRDGFITQEKAALLIKEKDYICDPASKRDFCRTIGITEEYFNKIVDKHANKSIVVKDINGVWRRKDLI